MTEYRVERFENLALIFKGDLLAERSSYSDGTFRWLETRIYRTDSGQYITEMVGRSNVPTEDDKITVRVYDRAAHVRLGFLRTRTSGRHKGEKYLTVQAELTIEDAASKDPALLAALTERI